MGFNSRSRMGSDETALVFDNRIPSFNSRSRMGSDRRCVAGIVTIQSFKSRSRMGSDCSNADPVAVSCSFNSRSRMGSDNIALTPGPQGEFQFTLPHGERPETPAGCDVWTAFQFTLPHGERRDPPSSAYRRDCFNSRSRMGSDWSVGPPRPSGRVSIHAPAWGATSRPSRTGSRWKSFNSRSRMGSDQGPSEATASTT